MLLALKRLDTARDLAARALRGLAGFAKALKVKYQDIEVDLSGGVGSDDVTPPPFYPKQKAKPAAGC